VIRPKTPVKDKPQSLHLETVVEADEVDNAEDEGRSAVSFEDLQTAKPDAEQSSKAEQEVGQSSAEGPSGKPPARTHSAPPRLSADPLPPVNTSFDSESESSQASEVVLNSQPDDAPKKFRVFARICGHLVTKYTPPALPKLLDTNKQQQRASIFTFLQTGAEVPPKQQVFKEGQEVTTPYGPARVAEHRLKHGSVVVDMIGWHARGYLKETEVKPASKSLIRQFIRQLSSSEKPLDFPYAKGTVIGTPFGRGRVSQPIPLNRSASVARGQKLRTPPATIGISLESWTLADGTHPTIYTTVEEARAWKDRKADESSIFSLGTLNTLVESSRSLLSPFLSQKQTIQEPAKLYPQYYQDAAAVTTSFGNGTVVSFRPSDGFYEVSLLEWTLADGSHPKAYLRKEDISHRVAKGCQEGYPVLTSLGLSGTLASVVPTTGVHIVTVPSAGMVCYLQPECVVRPLKAAVGEDVLTAYGEGKVANYDKTHDMYTIVLSGWGAKLYCKSDAFDRVGDGIQDREAAFGVKWLLGFLFSSSEPQVPRSRSNSFTGSQSTSEASHRIVKNK